jgi:hypothetical protein
MKKKFYISGIPDLQRGQQVALKLKYPKEHIKRVLFLVKNVL